MLLTWISEGHILIQFTKINVMKPIWASTTEPIKWQIIAVICTIEKDRNKYLGMQFIANGLILPMFYFYDGTLRTFLWAKANSVYFANPILGGRQSRISKICV